MFGHDDDEDKKDDANTVEPNVSSDSSVSKKPSDDSASSGGDGSAPSTTDNVKSNADSAASVPDLLPASDNSSSPNGKSTDINETVNETSDQSISSLNNPSLGANEDDELLDIKKDALQDLAPLVDKLDQSPDEKFRTTMMMIQASDDKSLIKRAYDAAKTISDEKERAQALLDIVNEINYFTQPHESE